MSKQKLIKMKMISGHVVSVPADKVDIRKKGGWTVVEDSQAPATKKKTTSDTK